MQENNLDYQDLLDEIYFENKNRDSEGHVASYIPELAKIDPDKYGIYLKTADNKEFEVGDSREAFSIQSISKVISLAFAMGIQGNKIWDRIGVEPSGNPFNSIVQLEFESGIPRNPFINSGAIVLADILLEELENPKQNYLDFMRKFSNNPAIEYNTDVVQSEKNYGYRNEATANMLKALKNLINSPKKVLDFYYHQCSIEMSCCDLANLFLHFADHSRRFEYELFSLSKNQIKRINSIMLTCGFYDEAGEFAFKVGLPGKSGVGGGIVAIKPHDYCVACWSPRLNDKGNSLLGMRSLRLLTQKTGFTIF